MSRCAGFGPQFRALARQDRVPCLVRPLRSKRVVRDREAIDSLLRPSPAEDMPPCGADALARAEHSWRIAEATRVWCSDAASTGALRAALALYEHAQACAQRALDGSAPTPLAELTAPPDPAAAAEHAGELRTRAVMLRDDVNSLLLRARHQQRSQRSATPLRAWSMTAALAAAALATFAASDRIGDWLGLGEVSRGARWQASSRSEGFPLEGTLPLPNDSPPFFFHTALEDAPSLTIDLGREVSVRRAIVRNRSDCCGARALPLQLELSRDGTHWQLIARRDRPFAVWRTSFGQRSARWVRLRVPHRSLLHLSSVMLRS